MNMKKKDEKIDVLFFVATRTSSGQFSCSQAGCQNGASCQDQGSNAVCICKPGFTGQRCETGVIFMKEKMKFLQWLW